MKILILSCNTGEGHNSAGWAVKEYLELQGHQVVMEDMMLLKGARTSKAVGGAYVGIVKHFPLLFGLGYRLGGWVSSDKRKSPVYYACSLLAGTLKGYLEQKRFDAVVTPHLYPAETLTAMKKKGWLKIPVVAIGTDYTDVYKRQERWKCQWHCCTGIWYAGTVAGADHLGCGSSRNRSRTGGKPGVQSFHHENHYILSGMFNRSHVQQGCRW